jgi:hypothetical protein
LASTVITLLVESSATVAESSLATDRSLTQVTVTATAPTSPPFRV